MKLTSRGRYALQAILDILTHNNGKAVKLEDISDRQKISLHYLEQIFRNLRRAGVVKSVRGPGGGYVIISPDTTVGQVLEGAKEKLDYSTGVKAMENPTPEHGHLLTFLIGSEALVHERLKTKLTELLK